MVVFALKTTIRKLSSPQFFIVKHEIIYYKFTKSLCCKMSKIGLQSDVDTKHQLIC